MDNVNNTPQTGNEPQGDAAPQQTNAEPKAEPALPVESDEVRGLRQAADAERKKRQELESQLAQTQGFLSQVAAQMRTQPQAQPQQPAEEDYLGEFTDNDLLDPARFRQGVNKAIRRVREQVVTESNQTVQQLRFQTEYPDFDQLVGSSDPMTGAFRPSELLQEAYAENPRLQRELNTASGQERARIAYIAAIYQKQLRAMREAAKAAPAAQVDRAAQMRHADNTVAAVTQPMSPSAVSGTPANSPTVDYRAMVSNPQTAAQFDALIQDALRGKFG